MRGQEFGDLARIARNASPCAPRSERQPRSVSHALNGDSTAPVTCRRCATSCGEFVVAARTPARRRARRCGRRNTWWSNASRCRRPAPAGAAAAAWRRCCRRPRSRRPRARCRRAPAMSLTFISGFDGVSIHSIATGVVQAARTASRSPMSTASAHDSALRQEFLGTACAARCSSRPGTARGAGWQRSRAASSIAAMPEAKVQRRLAAFQRRQRFAQAVVGRIAFALVLVAGRRARRRGRGGRSCSGASAAPPRRCFHRVRCRHGRRACRGAWRVPCACQWAMAANAPRAASRVGRWHRRRARWT